MKNYLLSFASMMMILLVVSCNNSVDTIKQSDVKSQVASVEKVAVEKAAITSKKVSSHSVEGGMEWYGMGEVEELIKKEKKMIIVDVYTKWCGPCKMMDKNTFTDPAVQKAIGDRFYPVKFDAEGADAITFQGKEWANPNYNPGKRGRNARHELANFFSVRGYPTLVVLDENFKIIKKLVGYKTPDKLLPELAMIK